MISPLNFHPLSVWPAKPGWSLHRCQEQTGQRALIKPGRRRPVPHARSELHLPVPPLLPAVPLGKAEDFPAAAPRPPPPGCPGASRGASPAPTAPHQRYQASSPRPARQPGKFVPGAAGTRTYPARSRRTAAGAGPSPPPPRSTPRSQPSRSRSRRATGGPREGAGRQNRILLGSGGSRGAARRRRPSCAPGAGPGRHTAPGRGRASLLPRPGRGRLPSPQSNALLRQMAARPKAGNLPDEFSGL